MGQAAFCLYIQLQMLLNGLLQFLLLDTDVPLSYGGAAVLEELLDKCNVVMAALVNLCGVELPKAVGADTL